MTTKSPTRGCNSEETDMTKGLLHPTRRALLMAGARGF